jgi:UDP-N-acetylmuramoyl-L-alanyl-D-glutamate--2,6-diaminopimelate ligase
MTEPMDKPELAGKWLRQQLQANAQLTADSRRVTSGDGFLAFGGLTTDGRQFVGQACQAGAAAVLCEAGEYPLSETGVPVAAYTELRSHAGAVSSAYYGYPSSSMLVFAVTGTNGKTTCANWLAQGSATAGQYAASIGTLGVTRYGKQPGKNSNKPGNAVDEAAGLTTPDAVSLQRTLAALASDKVNTIAFEASSIGLHQQRLQATDVDVAVFTNLTRDHLDYHDDMASYQAAKQQLFAMSGLKAAVVNADDPAARDMIECCDPAVARYAFGTAEQCPFDANYVRLHSVQHTGQGLQLRFSGDLGEAQVQLSVLGEFNALNAAAVCTAWAAAGQPFDQAVAQLATLDPIPGRMQPVIRDGQPIAVIDYAHTPDALRAALTALRPLTQSRSGRLWVVFGCGGDRDAGKRVEMCRIAVQSGDRTVVTSDNPRSENPEAIIEQIVSENGDAVYARITDRQNAIHQVIAQADANDVVLIAGKGHENYQEINGQRFDFCDLEQARAAIDNRGGEQ